MLKRTMGISLLILLTTCIATLFICDHIINKASKGKLYNEVSTIPYNRVGILLGTGKNLANGYENLFYKYRIQAATALIRSGKIKYLVISGDNSRKDYNEPQDMKESLIQNGIDSTVLFLDYAGFRTFDSMVRIKKIFGQDSVTVISQPFHNQRAIYLASREGISAIGYNALNVNKKMGFRTQVREKFARVKVFIDYIVGNKPKYLGPKVTIPS